MELWKSDRKAAYFSMEIGYDPNIKTYSGGLGILAGDTLRSCADLEVPIIGITLLWDDGYFKQKLDDNGNQTEEKDTWEERDHLEPVNSKVVISIQDRDVIVQAWIHRIKGVTGFEVPILFLDTDLPGNTEYDRTLTKQLYSGDHGHRIAQEMILGVAGYRMLKLLGYKQIQRYHLNEGHGSFLILARLMETKRHVHGEVPIEERYRFNKMKQKIVFTTHTPVKAGHDKFDPNQVKDFVHKNIDVELIDHIVKEGQVNMTQIALDNSNYVNGVAKVHARVSKKMFPGHEFDSITNGTHSGFWVCDSMRNVFDMYVPDWNIDPASLRFAEIIPSEEIWKAHMEAKKEFSEMTGLDPEVFTIGFARRSAPYKRLKFMFSDLEWLKAINKKYKVQIVLAGKAHPNDKAGKKLIQDVFAIKKQLEGEIPIVYIENYDIAIAQKMVAGVDLWLNTPQKPMEASGTSGMKAAHNGVPQMSTLDGWWIEGCLENITGWSIKDDEVKDFYTKLENDILPKYYDKRDEWIVIMRSAIALNASYFNTHRMVKDYVTNAYFE